MPSVVAWRLPHAEEEEASERGSGSEPQQDVVDQGDGQSDEHPEDHAAAESKKKKDASVVLYDYLDGWVMGEGTLCSNKRCRLSGENKQASKQSC